MLKRLYDLTFAACGIVLLGPLLLLLALAIRQSDGGPVFFCQQRVGRFGRLFWIFKFRTMVTNAEQMGLGVTRGGDPRITRLGRLLRKTKLDELPQLWNVVRGEMSLVGPRPEVPKYVGSYTHAQRQVLALKPGITDLATILFRNEEDLLRPAANAESFYLEFCVPRKIELNLAYARQANVWEDTKIILRTVFRVPGLKSQAERSCAADRCPPSAASF